VLAGKPLDTLWGDLSSEVSSTFVLPAFFQGIVVLAVRIWTEGWNPDFVGRVHAPEGQESLQKQFPWHTQRFSNELENLASGHGGNIEETPDDSAGMPFIENDHVVEALALQGADHPFAVSILPGGPR
jgi:hypothetical protein